MRRNDVQRHATKTPRFISSSTSAGLLVAIGLLGSSGCVLVKEPLRSGWLADGVYPQPPPPPCNPPSPPGLPFDVLSAHPVPAGEGAVDLELDLPGIGKVTARVRAAASSGPGVIVSSRASRTYRVLDEQAASAQVPGFVHRVDLRFFSRVAFVADVSGYMCEGYKSCPEHEVKFGPPAPYLQAMGDQIDAGVAGMRPEQFFAVVAGDDTRSMRFTPDTAYGRGLAGQFVRGQVCSGQRAPRALIARALKDSPEVIVLMSDGSAHTDHGYEDRQGGCAAYPNAFHCTIDEKTETIDLPRFTDGKTLPPVIAISVHRKQAKWMIELAEATGGVYLDAAR